MDDKFINDEEKELEDEVEDEDPSLEESEDEEISSDEVVYTPEEVENGHHSGYVREVLFITENHFIYCISQQKNDFSFS